eukprot:5144808-Heterocapsa_arctica.AAC.1
MAKQHFVGFNHWWYCKACEAVGPDMNNILCIAYYHKRGQNNKYVNFHRNEQTLITHIGKQVRDQHIHDKSHDQHIEDAEDTQLE